MTFPPRYNYYHSATLIFPCPGGMSGHLVHNSLRLPKGLLGNQCHFFYFFFFFKFLWYCSSSEQSLPTIDNNLASSCLSSYGALGKYQLVSATQYCSILLIISKALLPSVPFNSDLSAQQPCRKVLKIALGWKYLSQVYPGAFPLPELSVRPRLRGRGGGGRTDRAGSA